MIRKVVLLFFLSGMLVVLPSAPASAYTCNSLWYPGAKSPSTTGASAQIRVSYGCSDGRKHVTGWLKDTANDSRQADLILRFYDGGSQYRTEHIVAAGGGVIKYFDYNTHLGIDNLGWDIYRSNWTGTHNLVRGCWFGATKRPCN